MPPQLCLVSHGLGELELRRLNLIGPGREVESLSGTAANLITLGLDGNSQHILP